MKFIISLVLIITMLFTPAKAENTKTIIDADHIKTRTAIIYDVDYENNIVYTIDAVNHIWYFYETEDWAIGDVVSFTIWDSNDTHDSIWDDEIISIGYSGWTFEEEQLNDVLNWIASRG